MGYVASVICLPLGAFRESDMSAEVFFIRVDDISDDASVAERVGRLADAVGLSEIAGADLMYMLKIHFGERGNETYVKPPWIKPLVERVQRAGSKIFLGDTNTLYVGSRSNAVDHLALAHDHGFTYERLGAPVVIADGLLGENQSPVEVNLKHYPQVYIANDAQAADGFVVVTNITGHVQTGLAGSIKNVGMGLAGRGGKRSQHCQMRPKVNKKKCVACGVCARWCPADAIDPDKCIGCGECYAVCRYGAISFRWSETSANLQEKLVEHCVGALEGKRDRSVFFNFMTAVTENCNCIGRTEEPLAPPIGIAASTDIVAVDKASADIIRRECGEDLFRKIYPSWDYTVQLSYGEQTGLGSQEYTLVEVS